MDDKLDEILDLLRSQNEMIKDIHDYVKEVTSEKYIGESRMTSFSINLAADILTEAISPKIKGMMGARKRNYTARPVSLHTIARRDTRYRS